MVAEMLHTASLIHDDVVDAANERRGIDSLNKKYGQRQSILSGNFIHTQASSIISSIGNPRVISLHSGVVEDIITAEFMQLGTKEDEQERFKHYMRKTHKKTASLIATYCKCFIDDVLDFIVGQEAMGKPTDSDLKLGLANGPVLYAAMEVGRQ
ncbi:decaprenyl-diphosphate synthase subunit 1 [Elysia marginata]|uniref:Decaprenyl-diphosphate synthase subunit 1 n=1 Tax=Elysia marginata TaxID=1093978 RepID=A0AAV4FRR9_9GAST|nr:decaprenyl-diphosphate synthase subunit 1 [Elysia marginata]